MAEIFAKHGEAYFRAVERQVLVEQLAPRHLVVATGGGTFADPQNRAAINRRRGLRLARRPLERLIDRVPADGRRPLAADRAGFEHLLSSAARGVRAGAQTARCWPGRG